MTLQTAVFRHYSSPGVPWTPNRPAFSGRKPVLGVSETLQTSSEAPAPQKQQQSRLGRAFKYLLLAISPAASFLGGVMALGSVVLPGQDVGQALKNGPPTIRETAGRVSRSPETLMDALTAIDPAEKTRATHELKFLFHQLGWTLMLLGLTTSSINRCASGYHSNQPSMVYGSIAVAGLSTGMSLETLLWGQAPSVALRGLLFMLLAYAINGFGNKMENEFKLKPGEKPCEFSMKEKFFSKEALHFSVVGDHQRMLHSLKNLKKILTEDKAALLKPSSLQYHVGGAFVYLGCLLMMASEAPKAFLESLSASGIDPKEFLVMAGGAVTGLGWTCANSSLVALGHHRGGLVGNLLKYGAILMTAGNATVHTTPGMAVQSLGQFTISNYMMWDALEKEAQATAAATVPEKS